MKKIKLVVLDVDGTLTDGKIYIDNNGIELKAFNVKDGLAIAQAINHGLDIAIITGRKSKIVEIRAKELGITEVYQNVKDKEQCLINLSYQKNICLDEVAYIGDDINDLKAMKIVGFSACPQDASVHVKRIANFISCFRGGEGAVREILEVILEEKGIWNKILDSYEGGGQ